METIFTNIFAVTCVIYLVGLVIHTRARSGRSSLWLPPVAAINLALSVGITATATSNAAICFGVAYVAAWAYILAGITSISARA